jgi:hypothetical protein
MIEHAVGDRLDAGRFQGLDTRDELLAAAILRLEVVQLRWQISLRRN